MLISAGAFEARKRDILLCQLVCIRWQEGRGVFLPDEFCKVSVFDGEDSFFNYCWQVNSPAGNWTRVLEFNETTIRRSFTTGQIRNNSVERWKDRAPGRQSSSPGEESARGNLLSSSPTTSAVGYHFGAASHEETVGT